jgi:hypothetical protein
MQLWGAMLPVWLFAVALVGGMIELIGTRN